MLGGSLWPGRRQRVGWSGDGRKHEARIIKKGSTLLIPGRRPAMGVGVDVQVLKVQKRDADGRESVRREGVVGGWDGGEEEKEQEERREEIGNIGNRARAVPKMN